MQHYLVNLRMNLMPKKSGFTLIELLITITIIAILSAIGLVAYGTFLKNARDAKRQSDLKFIQSALEQYHADKFSYPESLDILTSSDGKVYINQIPKDPTGNDYLYTKTGCGTGEKLDYCLGANMENTPPKSDPNCNLSDYNYCVTRP